MHFSLRNDHEAKVAKMSVCVASAHKLILSDVLQQALGKRSLDSHTEAEADITCQSMACVNSINVCVSIRPSFVWVWSVLCRLDCTLCGWRVSSYHIT